MTDEANDKAKPDKPPDKKKPERRVGQRQTIVAGLARIGRGHFRGHIRLFIRATGDLFE